MSHAFGHKFIVISDVVQMMNPRKYLGGPWMHLATVKRGVKEYIAFKRPNSKDVYIEEIDPVSGTLTQIKDDTEWMEISLFLHDQHLLEVGKRRDISVGPLGLPGFLNGKR